MNPIWVFWSHEPNQLALKSHLHQSFMDMERVHRQKHALHCFCLLFSLIIRNLLSDQSTLSHQFPITPPQASFLGGHNHWHWCGLCYVAINQHNIGQEKFINQCYKPHRHSIPRKKNFIFFSTWKIEFSNQQWQINFRLN